MITRAALVTATAALLALAVGRVQPGLEAAQGAPPNPAPQPAPQAQSRMADMMKLHEQMMAELKAADAKLDALVREMNAATGNAKVDATAAALTELVRQLKAMHEHMGQMHEEMHQNMMGRGMMRGR